MNMLKKKSFFLPVIILICFFAAGLMIFSDYGASADEHIQIEGAHITWRILMKKLGLPYPREFDELPELSEFQNRYYGQAAMLPVTLCEALNGFRLDSSLIIRLRHLWSFLQYLFAAVLFALMIRDHYKNQYLTASALLLLILQPRLFGDIFYNDRDLLLITWMLIFLFCFDKMTNKRSVLWVLLTGASLAIAINTRIFGLVLLAFPAVYFLFSKESRKPIIFMAAASILFLILISPIAWENPLTVLPNAAEHFLKNQRSLDTHNQASLLFMGQKYYEHEVPWYYLPLYQLISTPVTHLILAALGIILILKDTLQRAKDQNFLMYVSMLVIFAVVYAAVMIIRPVFYNGWRHFYFLSLPLLFFAIRGLVFLFHSERKPVTILTILGIIAFSIVNITWISRAHPYEIIYLNAAVRSKAAGKFDRDYWLISTPECMRVLYDLVPEGEIHVVDIDAIMDYAKIGMAKEIRDRFVSEPWQPAVQPVPFILYNYTNKQGNEKTFPGYNSIYTIQRDGMKIAELFEYNHDDLVDFTAVMETDDDQRYQTLSFDPAVIKRIEFYQCSNWNAFSSIEFSYSEDGQEWVSIPAGSDSTNGFKFEYPIPAQSIRIKIPAEHDNWSCGTIYLRAE
ncbi:MAG: glycosyltransferase family 39 protein [Anaerolineaceae bacterium]|nr:glycosyltransferase family 39 protein [Anaerolineaceae bacterium]